MHKIIKLDTNTNPSDTITTTFPADMLVVRNLTGMSILIRVGALDVPISVDDCDEYIGPSESVTIPVQQVTQFAFGYGEPQLATIPADMPTTSIVKVSANEPTPTFSGMPITSVQASVTNPVSLVSGTQVGLASGTNVGLSTGARVGVNNTSIPVTGYRTADTNFGVIPGQTQTNTITIPPTAFAVQFQILSADPFYVRAYALGVTSGGSYFSIGNATLPIYTVPISTVDDAQFNLTLINYSTSSNANIIVYFLYEPVDTNTVLTFPYIHTLNADSGYVLGTAGNNTNTLFTGTSHQSPLIYGFNLSVSNRGTTLANSVGLVSCYISDAATPTAHNYILARGICTAGQPFSVARDFSMPYVPAGWIQGTFSYYVTINDQSGTAVYDISGAFHAIY